MGYMDATFFWDSVAAGNPLAFQPEGGPSLAGLPTTKLGWGYWPKTVAPMPVDAYKWLEARHATQICNRWATDHTFDLQQAHFNGLGFVSWEKRVRAGSRGRGAGRDACAALLCGALDSAPPFS